MTKIPHYILKVSCQDQPGIVAAITRCIAESDGNIEECQQFDDPETQKLLMRIRFSTPAIEKFEFQLRPIIERLELRSEIVPETRNGRVLIMVSKMDHCLSDLMYRWKKNDLKMDLVGVISNHETSREQVESQNIPYMVMKITKENKKEQEAKLMTYIQENEIDLVVLARYMQILSDDFSKKLYGKVINIHHSFLPSFKGARAYHQAYRRGVKIIGATAHYVTADLDEGPIIEQEVARVKHSYDANELVRVGRDLESTVLSRAVRWHLENRVFLNETKTVVFN